MMRWLALSVFLIPGAAFGADQISFSAERANAMLPFVAQDRERAMNDRALCSADLFLAQKTIEDLQKQIAVLKKPAEEK